MTRQITSLAFAVAAALAMSSCASIDVNALPSPGNSFQGGYDIVMQFDNVLNLPARAKVTLDGITVGVVTDVAIAGNHVDVTSRIDPAVSVPSNIHAGLQQATLLGDIYIALDRPPPGGPAASPLVPGARIPAAQTTSPPQLEDTLAHLTDFLGSGSIQRIQNTVIALNRITPPSNNLRKIAAQFTADVDDLAGNLDTVDLLVHGVAQTAAVLHDSIPSLQTWFSSKGMSAFDYGTQLYGFAGKTLPSVGSVYSQGFWLVPFLNSFADAVGAIQKSKWAFESEVPKWRRLFTDFFLPQDKFPAINITSILGPDGRELSGNVHDVLRILGAAP
ncbi:MlaD family protein [Mycobacterium sp. Marseille-P9652]|uniref:MlaD family protein n=1 Tax=Mycobacterium sp. Marseille-P9652 TaxID=2654950 RepID=UPI0012E804EC|nr:MlaD family protein [Mycobacterium sp. Marseille-P9652]